MKIVFMGTPDYAVKTLETLIEKGHNVAAVFAQPDKPVGRKHILTPPPVKVCAQSHGIEVFQPETLKTDKVTQMLRDIAPDVIVVVAYGKILPSDILSLPKYGCVNGHASLLPKYRGASPIQQCIVCGEKETGVTTMLMDKGMDTGDILKTEKVKIGEDETADELFERLSAVSAQLMADTLEALEKGEITPQKQDDSKASYAPIIKKEMALLDFGRSAAEVRDAVRGYYSWPCAYFYLNGKRIKVIRASQGGDTQLAAGTVICKDGSFAIACGDSRCVNIDILQPEGSKQMTAKQFLCGNSIEPGTVAGNA